MPHRDKPRMILDRSFPLNTEMRNNQEVEINPQAVYNLSTGEKLYVNGILDQSPGNIDVKVPGNIAVFTQDKETADKAPKFSPTLCSRFLLMHSASFAEKSVYEQENKQDVLIFEEIVCKDGGFEKTGKKEKIIPR
ncbi:MAG: hypothetical protein WC794_03660 [Candidatus Doudnabacteria bacterium]|jgi:hypothetical protein